MSESVVSVGGLPLPLALVQAVNEGRWKPPGDLEAIRRVFGDEPDWPQFFDLESMVRQNRFFQSKSAAELQEEVVGSDRGLGVDPALAVLIGSLGADMPIALDYRLSRSNPRVIYLASEGWREVAADFAVLVVWLALSPSNTS